MIALETIYKGSKYSGCEIAITEEIDEQEYNVDLTGANIQMDLKRNDTIFKTLKTSDNTLLISANKIIIPSHTPTLEPGVYYFDFNIIMPNGDPFTGLAGGQWEILDPITNRNQTLVP